MLKPSVRLELCSEIPSENSKVEKNFLAIITEGVKKIWKTLSQPYSSELYSLTWSNWAITESSLLFFQKKKKHLLIEVTLL